jgi:type IV pilus assembly protein PilW
MDTAIMIPKLPKKYLLGLSLVELMVALVISSVLMAGVIYVFNSSKRTYILQTEFAELYDNARFVMDELTREIRMAGYFGCSGIPPAGTPSPFQAVNDVLVGGGFPRTDTLIITSFSEQLGVNPNTQFSSGNSTITLANIANTSSVPNIGDQIVVSDCRYSNNYTIGGRDISGGNPIITTNTVFPQLGYFPPVEVFKNPQPVTYKVSRIGENFTLEKCVPDPDCKPFVDGVQNMQVRYGIDLGADNMPDRYVTDPNNPSRRRVASVRITLLMRTTTKRGIICPTKKSFFLDPDLMTHSSYFPMEDNKEAETGYCHRLFTTTIDVRNSSLN